MSRCSLVAFLTIVLVGRASATGDVERGRELYANSCMACHSPTVSLAAPHHKKIFGRKAASVTDYSYTPAMRKLKLTWDEKTLDSWLQGPSQMAPGTSMFYSVTGKKDREDLIAYLKTL